MPVSFNDLVTNPTTEAVKNTAYSILATLGFPVTNWRVGGVGRTLVDLIVALLQDLPLSISTLAQSGLNSSSSGAWLTLLSKELYDNTRQPAAFTIGTLRVTNSTGSPVPVGVNAMIARSNSGKLYRNQSAFVVPANSSTDQVFFAEQVGFEYNVGVGEINQLSTPIAGISVNNPSVGTTQTWISTFGADEETDANLRLRNVGRWAELSFGTTVASYLRWALSASNQVTGATVTTPGFGGVIRVRLRGPTGGVLAGTVQDVIDYIEGDGPDGVPKRSLNATLDVASATPVVVTLTGVVQIQRKYRQQSESKVRDNLIRYFAGIPIGGIVRKAQIIEEIMSPDGLVDVSLVSPAGNIQLAQDEVASLVNSLTFASV